ncbi:hypothetical protein E4U47_002069 [Claviceps purpurea]|nr:hypothetical protein E4U47_002069 [Claviceps purpurea]
MTSAGKEATRRPPGPVFEPIAAPTAREPKSIAFTAFSATSFVAWSQAPVIDGHRSRKGAFLSVGGPDGEEREEAETRRKADFFREMAMDGLWGGIGGKARVG